MRIKSLFTILSAALLLVCCSKKTPSTENMNTLSFNHEQATAMTMIAVQEARGDQSALALAINEGFNSGLTISQIKEALSHLYAYTGFPRSLNALNTLQKVIEGRANDGLATLEGTDAAALPSDYDALSYGTAVQTQLTGVPFDFSFCPATDYYLKAHLFGDIFSRNNLTHADRELVTVSALSGLEGVMPQLFSHVRGATNMGVTMEQLNGIVSSLFEHGLTCESQRCLAAINNLTDGEAAVVSPSRWPLGEPNTAFSQYFIGNSYVARMDGGMANVTFEPACRNNWHIHHGATQVLVCVYGRGWYQEWGKEPVELVPGVVIAVPEGVKHWHGAAADSWMQHLTYHTDVKPNSSNQWLEAVEDEYYYKLK